MSKYCQSCGMPLTYKNIDMRGTEFNGLKNEEYCEKCYQNGDFVFPSITYDEMIYITKVALKSSKGSRFSKWLMIKSYPSLLKKTKRFKGGVKHF